MGDQSSPHDGLLLSISTGRGNRLGEAKGKRIPWGQFRTFFLNRPLESFETLDEFLKLPRPEQDKLKASNGWWLGGFSVDGRKVRDSIPTRDVITLDVEGLVEPENGVNIQVPPALLAGLRQGVSGLSDFLFIVHTSRKHTKAKPRFRIALPLKRPVTKEEYEPVARYVAEMLDPTLDYVDIVSFTSNQLMWFPTLCKKAEYIAFGNEDAGVDLVDPDAILAAHADWQDHSTHPVSAARKKSLRYAEKANDPTEKENFVGAFCRAYGIEATIAEFLPDVYVDRVDNGDEVRFTYAAGTGANGAVVYDDTWLYSHHGTDPATHKLCNAFDLVRLHLYRDLDGDTEYKNPTSAPSYQKMVARFTPDSAVAANFTKMSQDRVEKLFETTHNDGFDAIGPQPEDDPDAPQFTNLDGPDEPKERPSYLELMNKKHAFASLNMTDIVVITEARDPIDKKEFFKFSSPFVWEKFYKRIRVPDAKGNPIGLWTAWEQWVDRRTYDHVIFAPGMDMPENVFNLFRGWSVKPRPEGCCDLFLEHLWENICQGDSASYEYALNWMAQTVQFPQDKPGVGFVARGKKGTGKDMMFNYFGALFERNHVTIGRSDHFMGRFNAHQDKCLFLHVEEGVWAGDKEAGEVLKYIVSSPTMMVEAKFKDAAQQRSFMRIGISSNGKWVVPATEDERRWFVVDVGEGRIGDKKFFKALMEEGRKGGHGKLLHLLQTRDLANFEVRDYPDTEGLANQKLETLRGMSKFIHTILQDGELPQGDFGSDANWEAGPIVIDKDTMQNAIENWWGRNKSYGAGVPPTKTDVTNEFKHWLGEEFRARKTRASGDRHPVYEFSRLRDCQDAFARTLGSDLKWDRERRGEELI